MTLSDTGTAMGTAGENWTARKFCFWLLAVCVIGLLVGAGHAPRHAVLPLLSSLAFLAAGAGFLVRWRVAGHTGRQLGMALVVLGLHLPAGVAVEALAGGWSPALIASGALDVIGTSVGFACVTIAAVLARAAVTGSGLPRRAGAAGALVAVPAVGVVGLPSPTLALDLLAVTAGAWWIAVALAAWRTGLPGHGSSGTARSLTATSLGIGLATGIQGAATALPHAAITIDMLADLGLLAAALVAARVAVHGLTEVLTGQERYVAALLHELAGHERLLQATRACLHDARAAVAGIRCGTSASRHPAVRADAQAKEDLEQAVDAELRRLARMLHLPEPTPAVDVVDLDDVLRPLVVTHRARGLRLRWALSGQPRVLVDGDLLAIIVGNLLGNVLRHCSGATCHLTARVTDELTVTVTDDGPGLAEEERAGCFSVRTRHAASGGEGIGLAVSRDLARRHGGDLTLLDTDRGAAFRLTLPISAPSSDDDELRNFTIDDVPHLRLVG